MMGICSVQLSVRGCHYINGSCDTHADNDRTSRTSSTHPEFLVGSRNIDRDCNCHGGAFTGIEVQSESLDKHHHRCFAHRGRCLVAVYRGNDAGCLLHILWNDRDCVHLADHLVCVEMEASSRAYRLVSPSSRWNARYEYEHGPKRSSKARRIHWPISHERIAGAGALAPSICSSGWLLIQ